MKDINKRKGTGKLYFDLVDQNMHCYTQTGLSDTSAKRAIIKQMLNRIIPEKPIGFFRYIHQYIIDTLLIDSKTIKVRKSKYIRYFYSCGEFNDFCLKGVSAIWRHSWDGFRSMNIHSNML